VLALLVSTGHLVQPGTALLTLELSSQDLVGYMYVPASSGKQIQPGMRAEISPATVKQEEYGFVVGKVRSVSEFPVTSQGLTRLFGNDALVKQFLDGGPVLEVLVDPELSPNTPSGYVWSSSQGPAVQLTSGTEIFGAVVLSEDRPINLVIPRPR
jgi:HlyD family secretion protein